MNGKRGYSLTSRVVRLQRVHQEESRSDVVALSFAGVYDLALVVGRAY
jgi:hypothetical protein